MLFYTHRLYKFLGRRKPKVSTSLRRLEWKVVNLTKRTQNKINTDQLVEGMVIKNYNAMCELLGDKPCNGNSKIAQKKYWRRFFDWDNVGQKYVILSVYDEPLPEELSDNAVYAKFFELILMAALTNTKEGVYHFFPSHLFETFGMVSPEYSSLRDESYIETAFGDYGEVDSSISSYGARTMNRLTYKRLTDISHSSLMSLDNSGLIHYKRGYALKKLPWNIKGGFVAATDEQDKMILAAEQKAMNDLKITSKWYGYTSKLKKIFTSKINQYINEADPTSYGAVQWIIITYNKPPQEHWNRVESKIKRELLAMGYLSSDDLVSREKLINTSRQVLNDMIASVLTQFSYSQAAIAQKKLSASNTNWGNWIGDGTGEYLYLTSAQFRYEFDALVDRFIRI